MEQSWSHLLRSRTLRLLLAAALATALVLGGRTFLDTKPPLPAAPNTVQQMMDAPQKHEQTETPALQSDNRPYMYAGIHLEKIYELNLNSRTFTADGEIWLEWSSDVDELLNTHNTKASSLINLANRIETWDSILEPSIDGPRLLANGRKQLLFHFSSRFYDDAVDFRRDPFDVLRVPIIIELEPLWTSKKNIGLQLTPEPSNNNLVGTLGSLSGYQIKKASFTSSTSKSPNSMGTWNRPQFSQVRLEVTYQSNLWPGLVNWIIPLMIINAIVLMAPSVEGTLSDVRLAIPSTALLTLIFLQQSYHSSLPKLTYTTFLDDLFTMSYLIAMALFGLFTWGSNTYASAPQHLKDRTMLKINRADTFFQYISLSLLVLTAVISWWRR